LLVAVLVEVDLTVQMVVAVLVVSIQDLQQEVLLLIRLLLVVAVVPTHLVQTLCSIVIDQPVGVKDLTGTMQTVMGPTFQVDLVAVPPMIHLDLQQEQETNIPQHHPRTLEMLLDKEVLVVRVEIWQEMGLSLAVVAVVVPVVAVVTLAPVDRVQVVLDHQTFIKLDLQFFMLVAAVVDLNLMVLQVIWVVLQDQVAAVLDQIVVLDQQGPQILEAEEVERMLAADQDLVVREL
tara:strand:- start:130 stop:831 length:702 start_codon:yes stop_codon:yes gene_type:complete